MPGSLREIRPGVWKVRLYAGTDSLGRERGSSRTFPAKGRRAAERAAAEHTAKILASTGEQAKVRGTVAELVDLWVKHRASKDSPATVYRRQSITAAIKRDLGKLQLEKLTPLQIDQWYDQLRTENVGQGNTTKHRSESTIHHYHRVLHAILAQAYQWEMTERTPANRATRPKRRRHARVVIPPTATVRLLIETAPPDLGVAARVLAATGLRRGELAALRWTDVDLDEGWVRVDKSVVALPGRKIIVKQPKNEESIRAVEIDPTTVEVLDRHRRRWTGILPELADDAYLFPHPHSKDRTGRTPRTPDWMSRGWRNLCGKHGAKIRLHDLRHFHASTLIDLGVPVTAIAARHGHALTSTTTDIYGHPTGEAGRSASLQIESALRAR